MFKCYLKWKVMTSLLKQFEVEFISQSNLKGDFRILKPGAVSKQTLNQTIFLVHVF